jgi:flagellar export protein FliJ
MAVSRAMRRLLRVLEMQEEQAKVQMESALADLRRLERALNAAGERERAGRQLVKTSAMASESTDRLAGVEESRMASRQAAALKPRIAGAGAAVNERRREFMDKRVERRQAETVIERAEAQEAAEAGRRGQRESDDWFLGKSLREKNKER